ncbi:Sec-independent protein translocase protein TatB [Parvularcula marina]|uniref:Twin-arginine translocase subunit TatB n=1 Tax=Parvularcula marina TaxID=2292771 RepID=A0A371RL40_9PROT|nr:Sec-independent protein translocase protein TatB [Parvularcula marina]RFB06192.1 twin-arginine translocase subunit TatB [Parvularcula marina]
MNLVPQVGMVELLTLAILALIIVGPKDLPRLLYGAGKIVGKLRRMADEFRAGFDQMAREVEIEEMRKEIEELKKVNVEEDVRSALGEIDENLDVKKQSSGN